MNPLVLALIGLPICLGIWWRFNRTDKTSYERSQWINMAVFILIGTGYAFVTFGKLGASINSSLPKIYAWEIFILGIWFAIGDEDRTANAKACWYLWIIAFIIYVILATLQAGAILAALTIIITFALLAIITAFLGTIVTGLAIASLIYMHIGGGEQRELVPWKIIFSLLGIDTDLGKSIAVASTAILGALEKIIHLLQSKLR